MPRPPPWLRWQRKNSFLVAMLSLMNASLDGELQTESNEVSLICDDGSLTPDEVVSHIGDPSRPRRPTFLAIKKHARPAGVVALQALASETDYIPCMCSQDAVAPGGDCMEDVCTPLMTTLTTATPIVSPLHLPSPSSATTASALTSAALTAACVARRGKQIYADDGERLVRRVSYLKATSGDRLYPDSDIDSDAEDKSGVGVTAWRAVGALCELPSPASLQSSVARQGTLHVKLTRMHGKRAGDRSWKAVWAVVQGRALLFYKDKQHAIQTPLGAEDQISLRGAEVGVASDYTKRRHVLRVSTPAGSQLLLQADTHPAMTAWLSSLHHTANTEQDSTLVPVSEGLVKSSSASCLTTASHDTLSTTSTLSTNTHHNSITNNNNTSVSGGNCDIINVSPQTTSKTLKKMTSSLRTRSPTGQSPSTKTRKATGADSGSSPKSKTWKGRFSRHLRKMHGGSPSATPSTPLPEGATIGVCLEDCPQSAENDFLPLLVSVCVGVVETRGLHSQGIYRVPGNKAAVTYLTETCNRGPKAIDLSDPKWSDVNVISSLLKHFFQKLPDPLITSELYPQFIEASQVTEPTQRLVEIKNMVQELPDHHYETLRYLCFHLRRIVDLSDANKMDVRNLAIVFGPTLVRTAEDNMAKMVTDMSHQCRIVETLITHVHWFFSDEEDGDLPPPTPIPPPPLQSPLGDCLCLPSEAETPLAQALLLHNIPKVEGSRHDSKKILVSSIISAANRKVQKVRLKRAELLDETPTVSVHESHDLTASSDVDLRRVELPDPLPMSHRKVSSMSLGSVQEQPVVILPNTTSSSAGELVTSDRDNSREGCVFYPLDKDSKHLVDARLDGSSNGATSTPYLVPSTEAPVSLTTSAALPIYDSSLLGDEVAIRSYTGLSANTQERIRRFEQETRAMLQRDVTRHRRESKKWEVDRKKLEEEWYRAKCDLESDDILDQLADNPSEVVQKMTSYPWRSSKDESDTGSSCDLISPTLSRPLPSPNNHSHSGATNKSKVSRPILSTASNNATNTSTMTHISTDHDVVQRGCSDSMNEGTPSHDDGSDLLSAITATFEEKMRSLQDSPLTVDGVMPPCDSGVTVDVRDNTLEPRNSKCKSTPMNSSSCRLYRDPSLHRRRTSQTSSSLEEQASALHFVESFNSENSRTDSNLRFNDSLSKSEKTENNLKEKSEKRNRESKRAELHENIREKKPKELKRSEDEKLFIGEKEFMNFYNSNEDTVGYLKQTSEFRSRRHNVKELKEKFEQPNPIQNNSGTPTKQSSNKSGKANRRAQRNAIKRRHTVGGTKDIAKLAWLQLIGASPCNDFSAMIQNLSSDTALTSWEHLQPLISDSKLNTDRSLEAWVTRERMRTSSPDLSRLLALVLPPIVNEREVLHRRLSVRESVLKPLYPVLESHV